MKGMYYVDGPCFAKWDEDENTIVFSTDNHAGEGVSVEISMINFGWDATAQEVNEAFRKLDKRRKKDESAKHDRP